MDVLSYTSDSDEEEPTARSDVLRCATFLTLICSDGSAQEPKARRSKGKWTPEEVCKVVLLWILIYPVNHQDETLRRAVIQNKGKNWKKIAECVKDRTDVQCLHRWQKVLNPELVKGPWTKEEDELVVALVNKHGPKKWSLIASHLRGRIGKQCRER
jgi:hypothetical protein